jgi:hypothetical protein
VRTREHANSLKKLDTTNSAVAEHAVTYDHKILWNSVSVLHGERKYRNRLVLEAIEVRRHPSNFNRDDARKLSNIWATVLKRRRTEKTGAEESRRSSQKGIPGGVWGKPRSRHQTLPDQESQG